MNFQKYLIDNITDVKKRELLQKGNTVTAFEVFKKVNEYFESYPPGTPTYKPIFVNRYQRSNKDNLKITNKIEDDLKYIYTCASLISKELLISKENVDINISKIHKQIDDIQKEFNVLEKYIAKDSSYFSKTLSFANLLNVNTSNNTNKNIPITTCEIDYDTSTVRNPLLSAPSAKQDLTNSKVNIEADTKNVYIDIKNLKNIFNDNVLNPCTLITTSNSETTHSIFIDISLSKVINASKITLNGNSLVNTKIEIAINDGEYIIPLENKNGSFDITWRFSRTTISSLKLRITKSSYDYVNAESEKYVSYFVIKNISIYDDLYETSSNMVTKTVPFALIGDLIINADNTIPPNTDIDYYVGIEDCNDNVEWKSIKNNEKLDLEILYREEKILNPSTSKNYGSEVKDKNGLIKYYNLKKLPKFTNFNSVDVRTGYMQWNIEVLDVREKYNSQIPSNMKCNINDYNKKYVVDIAPLDISIMEILCERRNNYFILSQYINCDKEYIVTDRFFKYNPRTKHIPSGCKEEDLYKYKEIFDVKIIINGKIINPINSKYSFKLDKGENTIKIMCLLANCYIDDSFPIIEHNFNLSQFSDNIFCGPNMKRINHNTLVNRISKKDLTYYSIVEENGFPVINTRFTPNNVVKKHDPYSLPNEKVNLHIADSVVDELGFIQDGEYKKDIVYKEITDIGINNSGYYRTKIEYRYMTNSKIKKYFKQNDHSLRLRIMAKLRTSDISITPIINSITLIGE